MYDDAQHREALAVPGRGMAIASLVLGILALVLAAAPFLPALIAVVGCALGVIALVRLNAQQHAGRGQGRGIALAGVITGGVGIIAGIVTSILWAAVISVAGPQIGEVVHCFESSDPVQRQTCMDAVLPPADTGGEVIDPAEDGPEAARAL